jgi:hypothetical protein
MGREAQPLLTVKRSKPLQSTSTSSLYLRDTATTPSQRAVFSFLSQLRCGTIDFLGDNLSPSNEKRYVFVPTGYTKRHDQSMWRILNAIQITKLPNLLISVVGSSSSSFVNKTDEGEPCPSPTSVFGSNSHINSNEDSSCDSKILHLYLQSTLDFCSSVGGWIVTDRPWSYDSAATVFGKVLERSNGTECSCTFSNTREQQNSFALLSLDEVSDMTSDQLAILRHLVSDNFQRVDPRNSNECNITIPISNKHSDKLSSTTLPLLPHYSHYVFFENNEDKMQFQNYLFDLVPDLLVLVECCNEYHRVNGSGNCKVTLQTKQQMISSTLHGRPICLLYDSRMINNDITNLAIMYEHANYEFEKYKESKRRQQLVRRRQQMRQHGNVPESKDTNEENRTEKILYTDFRVGSDHGTLSFMSPDLTINVSKNIENDDKIIQNLLSSWPLNYQKETVVLVDISEMRRHAFSYTSEQDVDFQSTTLLQAYHQQLLQSIDAAYLSIVIPKHRELPIYDDYDDEDIEDDEEIDVESPLVLATTESEEQHLNPTATAIVQAECFYAWSAINTLKRTIGTYKLRAIAVEMLIIVCTFLSVAFAVVYAKFYASSSHELTAVEQEVNIRSNAILVDDESPIESIKSIAASISNQIVTLVTDIAGDVTLVQMILYGSTIGLPFLILHLNRLQNKPPSEDYRHSWMLLEAVVQQMESELIQFQMRVPNQYRDLSYDQNELTLYNNHATSSDDNSSEILSIPQQFHEGILTSSCYALWRKVSRLVPLNEISRVNQTISNYSNEHQSKEDQTESGLVATSIIINVRADKIENDSDKLNHVEEESRKDCISSTTIIPFVSICVSKVQATDEGNQQKLSQQYDYDPSKWKKKSSVHDRYYDYPNYDTFHDESKQQIIENKDEPETTLISSVSSNEGVRNNVDNEKVTDDFHLLTVPEYVKSRLDQQLEHRIQLLQSMNKNKQNIDMSIKYLTLSTTVLAIASYQWAIPIVLALVVAIGSSSQYRKHDQHVLAVQTSINTMLTIQTWWRQLSMDDQKQVTNQEQLVIKVEQAIIAYYNAIYEIAPTLE